MTLDLLFSNIDSHLKKRLPFVTYNLPGSSNVKAFFQKNDSVHEFKDSQESGFVMTSFNKSHTIFFSNSNCDFVEFDVIIPNSDTNLNTKSTKWDSDGVVFKRMVANAIETINNSSLEKVVLSFPRVVTLNCGLDLKSIFSKLMSQHQWALVYVWYHPLFGLWLGATPETLLTMEFPRFSTMSLAGTLKNELNQSPKWSSKEIDEQQIVTTYIRDQLHPLSSMVNIHPIQNIRAGNLWHLQTKISGVLHRKYSLKDLINALHPTPAVCGLPKNKAFNHISENESYDRKFYTGYLGEVNIKHNASRNSNKRNVENNAYNRETVTTKLFVNLRCMELIDQKVSIFVGAGITKDSIPDKEWIELCNKSETLSSIL